MKRFKKPVEVEKYAKVRIKMDNKEKISDYLISAMPFLSIFKMSRKKLLALGIAAATIFAVGTKPAAASMPAKQKVKPIVLEEKVKALTPRDYFPAKVGNEWGYLVTERRLEFGRGNIDENKETGYLEIKITKIEKKNSGEIVYARNTGEENEEPFIIFDKGGRLIMPSLKDGREFGKEVKDIAGIDILLDNPVKLGGEKYNIKVDVGYKDKVDAVFSITRMREKIEVMGKTFNTVKIDYLFEQKNSPYAFPYASGMTIWLAPYNGMVKMQIEKFSKTTEGPEASIGTAELVNYGLKNQNLY